MDCQTLEGTPPSKQYEAGTPHRIELIRVKRVYEPSQKEDGYRILVDRLWPRGLSKTSARIDLWLRDIAPSDGLRKWFSHDPQKWTAFQRKFGEELKNREDLVSRIRSIEKDRGVVTLVYSTKETRYNNAIALSNFLNGRGQRSRQDR
jgi:uncharacterized protein YeaO (DUF488 family)